jgi:hypothetical protein
MAQARNKGGDAAKFKRALDKQNRLEAARGGKAKHRRDSAEGEAARTGLPALEKHSKGRPKQKSGSNATARKSPGAVRSQSR